MNKWRWDESNGSATIAQTEKAYRALKNNGLVANFHSAVWNDLVDKLVQLLADNDISWIDEYVASDNMQINSGGILTAKKFNAYVQNLRYPYWNWHLNRDIDGYLGRLNVKRNDKVYGEYIIELAEHLNTFIGIYDGTADTGDMSYINKTYLKKTADIAALQRHLINANTALGGISHNTDLLTRSRVLASANDSYMLYNNAPLTIDLSEPALVEHDTRLRHVMNLIGYQPGFMLVNQLLNMGHKTDIISAGPSVFDVTSRGELEHNAMSVTLPPVYVAGSVSQASAIYGLLNKRPGCSFDTDLVICEEVNAALAYLRRVRISSSVSAGINVKGDIIRKRASNIASAVPINLGTHGSATRVLPKWAGSDAKVNVTVIGSAMKGIPKYVEGNASEYIAQSGEIVQKPLLKAAGSSNNAVSFKADMSVKIMSKVTKLCGTATSNVMLNATLNLKEGKDPTWRYPVLINGALYVAQVHHIDRIEEGIRIAWKMPVVGKSLYIPQVFHADQDENNLKIIYYSPQRTGDSLYIKQMNEILKGE